MHSGGMASLTNCFVHVVNYLWAISYSLYCFLPVLGDRTNHKMHTNYCLEGNVINIECSHSNIVRVGHLIMVEKLCLLCITHLL